MPAGNDLPYADSQAPPSPQPSTSSDAVKPTEWVVEVTTATDGQGWQYGTSFAALAEPRDGGRATRRPSDFVRRRRWLKRAVDASPRSRYVRAHDPRLLNTQDVAAVDAMKSSAASKTAQTAGAAFYAMLQARAVVYCCVLTASLPRMNTACCAAVVCYCDAHRRFSLALWTHIRAHAACLYVHWSHRLSR